MDNSQKFKEEIEKIWKEVEDLLLHRHKSYGESNLLIYGLMGIIIRIEDKLSRIWEHVIDDGNLYETDENQVQVSSVIEDALKDIIGYCVNALRLLRKKEMLPYGLRSLVSQFPEFIAYIHTKEKE